MHLLRKHGMGLCVTCVQPLRAPCLPRCLKWHATVELLYGRLRPPHRLHGHLNLDVSFLRARSSSLCCNFKSHALMRSTWFRGSRCVCSPSINVKLMPCHYATMGNCHGQTTRDPCQPTYNVSGAWTMHPWSQILTT